LATTFAKKVRAPTPAVALWVAAITLNVDMARPANRQLAIGSVAIEVGDDAMLLLGTVLPVDTPRWHSGRVSPSVGLVDHALHGRWE